MKKRKEILVEELLNLMSKSISQNSDLNMIIVNLPYFKKEIIKWIIDPILHVEQSFRVGEQFNLKVSEDEEYKVTFLEVVHDIHSGWCIKKSKTFESKRTVFLGSRGIEILLKLANEKIIGKKIITFADKHKISEKNYIPGIEKFQNGSFIRTLNHLDTTIKKGCTIVVFKEK